MSRRAILWVAILTGPAIWFLSMNTNFVLAPWDCVLGWKPANVVVSIIALLLVAGATLVGWSEWRAVGREYPGETGGSVATARVLASGAVLLNGLFLLVILAQMVSEILMGACS